MILGFMCWIPRMDCNDMTPSISLTVTPAKAGMTVVRVQAVSVLKLCMKSYNHRVSLNQIWASSGIGAPDPPFEIIQADFHDFDGDLDLIVKFDQRHIIHRCNTRIEQ